MAPDRLSFSCEGKVAGEATAIESYLHTVSGQKVTQMDTVQQCEQALLDGKTLLCTSLLRQVLVLDTQQMQSRGIQSTVTENVNRGPMYAFNEDYSACIALIRQRLRTTDLKVWESSVGSITRTKVGLLYLHNHKMNLEIVKAIQEGITQIQVDGIQDTGQLQGLLTKRKAWNLFPTMLSSERPDQVVASLLDGRVVIVMDGTPFVLIAPTFFFDFWKSSEDYYLAPIIAFFLRVLRFLAIGINLFLPAMYVALTSVNVDVNRVEISLAAAASREGVPYPVIIETTLMLLVLDLIVEAGTRLPKTISSTVTMVGGVVLGQVVVSANIVSNLLVIVVAATAITNFIVVDYQMSLVQRVLKYGILCLAGIVGVLGVVVSFTLIIIFLSRIESFGVSYLSPFGPSSWKHKGVNWFHPPLKRLGIGGKSDG